MQTRARPRESPPRHANLLARAMSPSAIALLGATATFGVLTDVERSALPAWCQGVSVKRIDDWFGSGGSGLKPLRFAQWDHPSEGHHQFNHGLYKGLIYQQYRTVHGLLPHIVIIEYKYTIRTVPVLVGVRVDARHHFG